MHVQFGGRFRIQVFHGDTDILLKDTGWFDNLITDTGMNLLAGGLGNGISCYLGSGNAEPAFTDTSLQTQIAGLNQYSGGYYAMQVTTLPYYGYEVRPFVFDIGAVQGTIREIGVGNGSNSLLSRALLRDTNGTPTELVVGGIDRLTVTYEFRQYMDISDVSYTAVIDGVTTDIIQRPALINTGAPYGSWYWSPSLYRGFAPASSITEHVYYGGTAPYIGTVYAQPSGTGQYGDRSTASYITNTYFRDHYFTFPETLGNHTYNAFRYTAANGNDGGKCGGAWQLSMTPGVTKTEFQKLQLNWRVSWARYTI